MKKPTAKNLYLDSRILESAAAHVASRKLTDRTFSLSKMVEALLIRELRKQRATLPPEFAAK